MKVILPGATGQLGMIVARQLADAKHEVIGIDRRPWPDAPKGVTVHQTDIRKRSAEELFRKFKPDAAIHMATVTYLREKGTDRYRINLGGTRAVVENCAKYGVKQLIFVGRHTYYGAGPDSPLYHSEDEPPLGAPGFPELADLVAADLYAGSAIWRFPKMHVSVLRLCYTLGPSRHGTLATFLEKARVPSVLGFDPLYQFMHEDDVARAIVTALEKDSRGVYNVAGPPPMPLSVIVKAAGRILIPLPETVLRLVMGRFGLPRLSAGALQHVKYPIVMDTHRFKEATGFTHKYNEDETIAAFRAACPV